MPATVPPIEPDVLTGFRGGDEAALERVFRSRYTPLTQEGVEVLHDGATAARTVEGVFVRAWKERERFQAPEDLDTFLKQAVHQEAVRRESRRAMLHRHDAHPTEHAKPGAPVPPVDESWAHVSSALHRAPVDAAQLQEQAARSRHDTAEHLAAIAKKPFPVVPVAVGAVAVLAGIGAMMWFDRAGADSRISMAIASPEASVQQTRAGQMARLPLADGSRVSMGADTRIRVAPRFGEQIRAVGLEGTAAFTVAAGGEIPFHVQAGNVMITAVGTAFGVRAYPAEEAVTVRVTEGQVTVKAGEVERALGAGQGVVVAKDGTMREPTAAELEESLGWTDGQLVVTAKPLREVLRTFTRWYGLELHLKDTTLLERRVTMRADVAARGPAVEALERSAGLVLDYEGKKMILWDTATAPKRLRKVK
jgi:ferric-dicitrate binding protein FerR (iron transport regulator)